MRWSAFIVYGFVRNIEVKLCNTLFPHEKFEVAVWANSLMQCDQRS